MLFNKLPYRPTASYLTALAIIGILFTISYYNVEQIIKEEKDSAFIINISGKQRMLTEKLALKSSQLIDSINTSERNTLRAEIVKLAESMETNHTKLINSSQNPLNSAPRMKELYFEQPGNADSLVHQYIAAAKQLASAPDDELTLNNPQYQLIMKTESGTLPGLLNNIVSQYQQESEIIVSKMQTMQKETLFLILVTLVLEALFIFRPMIKTIEFEKHRLVELNGELIKISSLDGLTGIANRRFFDQQFEQEWRRAQRQKATLAIILIDIDHFKIFNDTYGHLNGDDCLKKIAGILTLSARRSTDTIARYGGEEFVVILPGTDTKGISSFAENLRANVEAAMIPNENSPVNKFVTISLGGSYVVPSADLSPSQLIGEADKALYEAKRSGRNQFIISPIVRI